MGLGGVKIYTKYNKINNNS